MTLFKTNPFGHNLFIKKWLIRIFGLITQRRYRGFNYMKIEKELISGKFGVSQRQV